jgi:hypothetical protein
MGWRRTLDGVPLGRAASVGGTGGPGPPCQLTHEEWSHTPAIHQRVLPVPRFWILGDEGISQQIYKSLRAAGGVPRITGSGATRGPVLPTGVPAGKAAYHGHRLNPGTPRARRPGATYTQPVARATPRSRILGRPEAIASVGLSELVRGRGHARLRPIEAKVQRASEPYSAGTFGRDPGDTCRRSRRPGVGRRFGCRRKFACLMYDSKGIVKR